MNKKKDFYLHLIDQIDKDIWLEELKQVGRNKLREGIRGDLDRIADTLKGIEREIERVKKSSDKDKEKQLQELYDAQLKYNKDSDMLKEQMMGKWIEKEQQFHGGLDEEIRAYIKVVDSRKEMKELVKSELKKL